MALAILAIPPDHFSLPLSASLHFVQAAGLGLLLPQFFPSLFSLANMSSNTADTPCAALVT